METICNQNTQQQLNLAVSEDSLSPLENQLLANLMGPKEDGQRKSCSKCRQPLPISQFHKSKSTGDGLSSVCKSCKYKDNKAYYSSKAGKAAVSGQTKRKWIRTKQRVRCRNTVNLALAANKLEKKPCSVCGTTNLIEAHHEDYSKPFEIIWLCKRHHMEVHGKTLSKQESEYENPL